MNCIESLDQQYGRSMKYLKLPKGLVINDDFNSELINNGFVYNTLASLPNFNRYGYLKGICLVLDGVFSFQFESLDKSPHFSGIIGEGDWFGSSSLFIHEKTCYQVQQITPVKIFYIPESKIIKMNQCGYPIFELLYYISRELNLRTAQWVDICLDKKEERLLFIIVEIISRIPERDGTDNTISLNITQERLGELCHLSRPKLNKLLLEAKERGFLSVGRGIIYINKRKTLDEFNKREWRFHRSFN